MRPLDLNQANTRKESQYAELSETLHAAQEAALSRMVQAGAVKLTTIGALLEWQRDWKNKEHYNALKGYSSNIPALTAAVSEIS